MTDLVERIVFLGVGLAGGYLVRHVAQRPKLRIAARGHTSYGVEGKSLMITWVDIYNDPSSAFFGLKVNREPAQIKNAQIFDPALKESVGPSLVWQKGDPSENLKELEPEHTIGSGLVGRLFLFVKEPSAESFSTYRARALDTAPEPCWLKYKEPKRLFTLKLFDVNRRESRFSLDGRNGEGGVSLVSKKTSRDRWQTLLEVFR